MNKNTGWKAATIVAATFLMISLNPEIRVLGFLVQAVGLDVLVLLLGAQIAIVFGVVYHQRILPTLLWLNSIFERIDSFYFIPSRELIRKYPPIAMHSVPFLVPLCFLVLGHVFIYA